MALGPEERNKTQEVFVINLSDNPNAVPEYLKAQLVKNGLSWRVVELSANERKSAQATKSEAADGLTAIKTWPRDKEEIIDSLLLSYGVPFGVAEGFSVELRDGLGNLKTLNREEGSKQNYLAAIQDLANELYRKAA